MSLASDPAYLRTSVLNVKVSIAICVFLAYYYMAAVINPWGKNIDEIQYDSILSWTAHF